MCLNCSTTVETCVANHIHTFGHTNYSKQMCLLVLLQNAYWHFNSFSVYDFSMCFLSERSIFAEQMPYVVLCPKNMCSSTVR